MTRYLSFGEDGDRICFPRPEMEGDVGSVEWLLRYSPKNLTRGDQLYAASVISAYGHLIVEATDKKVRHVRREIRQALKEEG